LLERMQLTASRDSLDSRHLAAVCLDAEHQAGGHDASVENHGAGAAVAVVAAFLAAGEPDNFAQALEQGLARLGEELDRFSVDGRLYVNFRLHDYRLPLARSTAALSTR